MMIPEAFLYSSNKNGGRKSPITFQYIVLHFNILQYIVLLRDIL